jgi:type VI secretion system protein ImpL
MPLSDFGEVFGYGGLFDKFFTDKIDKLVDTTRLPWAWRPGYVEPSPGMLAQFERAGRIRQMFFSPGSKTPTLAFTVRLANLDPSATRFYLNIDDQGLAVERGAESRSRVVWPGPEKRGIALATFEDRVAAPDQVMRFEGPWAWLRLIDAVKAPSAQTQPETDLSTVLRFQTRLHQALVTIEASNATSNPFAARDWRQFKCDP